MAKRIVNPSGKTYFYNKSAAAITEQPKLGSLAKALGANQTGFVNVGHGLGYYGFVGSRIYASKRTQIMGARLDTEITGASVAAAGGLAKYTKASHGLGVGNVIFVVESNNKITGIQRVISIDGNDFTTDMPYVSGADSTISIRKATGTIALSVAGRYLMPFMTTDINGVASTILKIVGADYGQRRSINKFMTAGRHPQVAKAIAAGYWSEFTGKWTTAPTVSNDSIGNVAGSTVTDGTADHAANMSRTTPGELVYRDGSLTPKQDDYPVPTS